MTTRQRIVTLDKTEEVPLYGARNTKEEKKPAAWNSFLDPPRAKVSGSMEETKLLDTSIIVLKFFTVLIVFLVVLGGAIVSKGTLLFMTSQIRKNITRLHCNAKLDKNQQFVVTIPEVERVTWIWFLIFTYWVPEIGTLIRSIRVCIFKSWVKEITLVEEPTTQKKIRKKKWNILWDCLAELLPLLFTELCPAIGSAIFVFVVLPELDVIKGAMLTNAVSFVPAFVRFFSRKPNTPESFSKLLLDTACIVAQASAFVIWPLIEDKPILYMIPVSVILISVGWWENFVSETSPLKFISNMAKERKKFKNKKYFYYIIVSVAKAVAFFITVLVIFWIREDVNILFDNFYRAFQDHTINVTGIEPIISTLTDYQNVTKINDYAYTITSYMTPVWVFIINCLSTYICYAFAKFACKVLIQTFGYALPVNIAVPVLLSGLIIMCGTYMKDECAFAGSIPPYLFFTPPPLQYLNDFISHQHSYIWLLWLLSQVWISIHIWDPFIRKLASTEEIFMRPMYDAFLIDQSLALNRRRVEKDEAAQKAAPTLPAGDLNSTPVGLTNWDEPISRIIACATMWHETREEMLEFLKSIFRLDEDHCAHRIVRSFFQYPLESYYEFETHIFFDDAFIRKDEKDVDPLINEYVQILVSSIEEAASEVHETTVALKPPKIYPTPYGGRLVWVLPGKTKLIAHLKDKKKIRPKKRWSQVMYMYYLLGFHIMENDEIVSDENKNIAAENTYLLALDGDIDFQPQAVHLLMDYMRRKRSVGAACGRIHPIGSGAMAWYQIFEYAVGHWMQKATEHVIGCVLCSPGCFSLFRAKALMDKSVMKKYTTRSTEAKHYVQFDQGEDRWLCTLLLQRGWRVEYSAASDAYTHCPEGFNEFYNQRRRWMPSTMANIMDLLMSYKDTVKINDDISTIYIMYQMILMVGTVLGPGTIFLMLVGAFVTAFGLDQWSSFFWNIAPILLFIIVCATCKSDIQLFFAAAISAVYGLVMMAVVVGVMLQISEDGFLAPSSLFFFCVAGEMILAAFMHPKEFYCLKYGIIYYVTVPSMYMLLVIYSVFNMNNVSWGTRDVSVAPKPKADEQKEGEDEGTDKKDDKKDEKKKKNKVLSYLGATAEDNEGAIEFSLNKLFKCMLCTYRKDEEENVQLKAIQTSLDALAKKLDLLEQSANPDYPPTPPAEKNDEKKPKNNKNPIVKPTADEDRITDSWFYDEVLFNGQVHYLDKKEKIFWKDLIKEYLHPIQDDEDKVKRILKDLRDKMVFTFFMLNSLFVLVVFLLTLKKDILHINWPINPKINFSYVENVNEFHLTRTYLQLEPIGFVFLIFFALLMVIQFIGMMMHRFGTFCQIIANTNVEWWLTKKSADKLSREEMERANPLKVARDLMKLKGINNEAEEQPEVAPAARKSVSNLAQFKSPRVGVIFDIEDAFHKRFNNLAENEEQDVDNSRRKSVAWAKQRLQNLEYKKRMSQFVDNNEHAFINKAFIEGPGEEDYSGA